MHANGTDTQANTQTHKNTYVQGKVCYYLVSHFFGRSMQYKPELLKLSEQLGDLRVISSEKLKAFLDASKIPVPRSKVVPLARYYTPAVSPRTSEAFVLSQGAQDVNKVGLPLMQHAAH
jgi:hypothetical protein